MKKGALLLQACEGMYSNLSIDYFSPWEGRIVGQIMYGRNVSTKKVQGLLTKRYGGFRLRAFSYLMIGLFLAAPREPYQMAFFIDSTLA